MRDLSRWLLLAPGVFFILWVVGQLSISLRPPAPPADVRSSLKADYQRWSYEALAPIDPTALFNDLLNDPENRGTPLPIQTISDGNFWNTETPVGQATPTSTASLTPLPPTETLTPTPTQTATRPTSTITVTSTPSNTPTRTQVIILPTRTPTRTLIPTFTSTPTRVPTKPFITVTPSLTFTQTVTVTHTPTGTVSTREPSSLAITSRVPDASVAGQPVAVGFALQPGGATGSVVVNGGDGSTCTAVLPASSCILTFSNAGSKNITAVYSGDSSTAGSISPAVSHVVAKAATTLEILTHLPHPSTVNQPVTVTFRLEAVAPGAGAPDGVVTISSSDGQTCAAILPSTSCSLTFQSTGAKSLTASYGGSDNFGASASPAAAHTVSVPTALEITSTSPQPSVIGQAVTVNFNISAPLPFTPTSGSVVITSDDGASCTAALPATSCSLTFTSAGLKSLSGSYSGDAALAGTSTTSPALHTVDKAGTAVRIDSSQPNPSSAGEPVTVRFSLPVSAPGAGTPTGSVTIQSDDGRSCTAVLPAAACQITFTTSGGKVLTASYSGDPNFISSVSAPASHTVKPGATLTITGRSPEASVVGQPVRVAFDLAYDGADAPTGSVVISDGVNSCTAALPAPACDLVLTTVGARSLVAAYSGDGTYGAGVSNPVAHTVNPAATSLEIPATIGQAWVVGETVNLPFQLSVQAPGAGSPSGTVTLSVTGPAALSCAAPAGSGSCSLALPLPGVYSVTAAYPGDGSFTASSSGTGSLTVQKAGVSLAITSHSPDPSSSGQAVSVGFRLDVLPPGQGLPSGSVTVSSDDGLTCTAVLPSTSCAITYAGAGIRNLTATYSGDDRFNTAATASPVAHTVTKAAVNLTVSAPSASVVGEKVQASYTLEPAVPGTGTPTGTVTLSTQPAGPACLLDAASSGSCVMSFTAPGSYTIIASYSGDANFNSGAAQASIAVSKAGTSISISSSPNPSPPNHPVVFSFTLAVTPPGEAALSGTVTVNSSDGLTCTAVLPAATCAITFPSAGSRSVTAVYSGSSVLNGSVSTPITQVVDSNITIEIGGRVPSPSVAGQPVSIGFNLTPTAPGTPTGSVTISSDDGRSCTAVLPAASCSITFLSAGIKTLTAAYTGDSTFGSAVSSQASHTVNRAATALTITSAGPDPSVTGQEVTVSFNLAVQSPGSGTPTGSVTITSSDGRSCSAVLPQTSCKITFLTSGVKSLTASYPGDENFGAGVSAPEAHTVNKASTAVVIASHLPDPSAPGQEVSIAFNLSVLSPGSGAPTGSVTIASSDGPTCTAVLPGTSCKITFLTSGSKSLTATYSGDGNFSPSASAAVSHTVMPVGTSLTITSDTPDPSVTGQVVTVTFQLTTAGPDTPTGTVTVSSDDGRSCAAVLPETSCTITFLSAGSKSLTATYPGDLNFAASTSAPEPHSVVRASTSIAITSDTPDPSLPNSQVAVSFALSVSGFSAGSPTGTVRITSSDGQECSAALSAGSCSLTFTTVGAKTLTATYSGDANFSPAVSAAEPHTVTDQSADLSVKKYDSVVYYVPNSTLNYTVIVTNHGPANVFGAVVTDARPPQISSWTWTCVLDPTGTCTGGSGNPTTGHFSDTINLLAGQSITYSVSAKVPGTASGTISNTAYVQAPSNVLEIDPSDNASTDTNLQVPENLFDLEITNTDGVATYTPGGTLTYTITLSNLGPGTATNAEVRDARPIQIASWTWTCFSDPTGTCTPMGSGSANFSDFVTLAAGQTIVYRVTAVVSASAADYLINTASVFAGQDINTTNNQSTDADRRYPETLVPLPYFATAGYDPITDECVGVFGYDNPTGSTMTIPIGSNNLISPSSGYTIVGSQPTVFSTGTVANAFQVRWPFTSGLTIFWKVNGSTAAIGPCTRPPP